MIRHFIVAASLDPTVRSLGLSLQSLGQLGVFAKVGDRLALHGSARLRSLMRSGLGRVLFWETAGRIVVALASIPEVRRAPTSYSRSFGTLSLRFRMSISGLDAQCRN